MKENNHEQKTKSLAVLLSSLISQILLILLLLFPSSSSSSSAADPISFLNFFSFPLLHHFLSTSEIIAVFSVIPFPKKRKRTLFEDPEDDNDDDEEEDTGTGFPGSIVPKSPDSFKIFFKMNSSTFEWLCGLLEPLLECRDPVNLPLNNLSVEARLGIGLFRLATGSDYQEISSRFGVSELVSRFCVKQLCRVLCTNYRFWVGFPSPNELGSASSELENQFGLPNCCGIIGFARFKINVSKGSNSNSIVEDIIAAQLVTDSSSRILSITAGFRGKISEFMVLKSSALYKDIEKGALLNSEAVLVNGVEVSQYLVGGEEYPLLSWLMIPFIDPKEGSAKNNFNNVIEIMRVPMLKAIKSLRNWGILSKPIDAEFKAAVAYVGSCSILHNMLLTREDFSAFCDELSDSTLHEQQGFRCSQQEDLHEKASMIRSALVSKANSI